MEGGAGDSTSWDDLVTHAEASPGASKRKKTDAGQPAPHRPFPLASEGARKEVMGLIYEHTVGLEPPRKNIALESHQRLLSGLHSGRSGRVSKPGTLHDR